MSFTEIIKKRKGEKKVYEKKKKSNNSQGFTFVETLAVLSIGAVLAAGSTVAVSRYISIAKETSARNQIAQYSAALQTYFLDCGCFPTTEQGIMALWEKPVFYPVPENWKGPYLDRLPGKDPWGNDFEYLSSESSVMPPEVPENMPYILRSFGADKEKGGDGHGTDILSWK